MPVNTQKLTEVTQAIFDALEAQKIPLGLQDIWYGDQKRIPRTPALCVESAYLTKELDGVGRQGRTMNTFTVYVICYLGKVDDNQNTRKVVDQLAEQITDVLDADVTLSGTVIHGFVHAIEPGYSTRQGELFRVARVTWQGITKTSIGG